MVSSVRLEKRSGDRQAGYPDQLASRRFPTVLALPSTDLDQELVQGFGVQVPRTPPQSPQANAFCERLIGTIRRECLDFMIPLNEKHLRRILSEWVRHYNTGRPHSSLGPGIPAEGHRGPVECSTTCTASQRKLRVISRPVLGGLHDEYAWEKRAA